MDSFLDRFRIAVAAMVVSGGLLAAGASWLLEQVELQVEREIVTNSDRRAGEAAGRLARLVRTTDDIEALRSVGGYVGPFEVRDENYRVIMSCPAMEEFGGKLSNGTTKMTEVLPGREVPVRVLYLSGEDNDAACVEPAQWRNSNLLEVRVTSVFVHTSKGRYEVTVGAPIAVGDPTAADSVRRVFETVVPAVALLIGVLAWLAVTTSDTLVRLNSALERQRRFTSDASHELRTPLASARTQLEVLLAHPDRIDWRRTAENTVLDLDRMQAVVTDLLYLARLAGPVGLERVDLAALVDVPGPVEVMGDRAHLERVVRNLLDNAERHASSRVEVSVVVESGAAVLRVVDDGPGIPEVDRERVFEPFVRLDEGRARDEGGAGLGLAIVREGVRAHGGTVGIEDSAVGTVVTVRLPLA